MGERRLGGRAAALLIAAAGALYAGGLAWNLPSEERAALVLPPHRRTPETYAAMKAARESIYDRYQGAEAADIYAEKHGLKPKLGPSPTEEELAKHLSNAMVQSGQGDEHRTLIGLSKMRPSKLQFNPHMFFYGGPFVYLMGAGAFAAAKSGAFRLVPDIAFYYQNPGDMRRLWLALRWTHWAVAVAFLAGVWAFARAVSEPAAALWTLGLFALTPVMVHDAPIVKPHMLGTLFWLAAAYACLRLARSAGGTRGYAAAGALAGLATGTAHEGVTACLLIFLAHLHLARGRWADARLWGRLVLAAGLSVAVYFAVNPYVLVSLEEFRLEIFESAIPQFPFRLHPVPLSLGWWVTSRWAAGTALWALMHLALFAAWKRGGEDRWLACAFAATWLFTVFLVTPTHDNAGNLGRDLLGPLFLATLACGRLLARLKEHPQALRGAAAGLAAVGLLANAGEAAACVLNYRRDSPAAANAMRAGAFLNTLPEGASLGIHSADLRPGGQPPFDYRRFKLVFLKRTTPAALESAPPAYLVFALPLEPTPSWERVSPGWLAFLERYEPAASFAVPLPLFGAYVDTHYHSNFPVHVFKRRGLP